MSNIFDIILANIDKATAVVIALAGLITTIIVQYKKMRELVNRELLMKAVTPLIAQAEEAPIALLNELVNKPVGITPLEANSNDGKRNLVTQALIEREPALLKKAKLTDIIEIGKFISTAYSTVKPIVKVLKK